MALTKIALSLLGTIALSAGTLLAVSEPGSAPLPTVQQPAKCSSCPGKAATAALQACQKGTCQTTAAACAVPTSAENQSACAAGRCETEKVAATACESDRCDAEKERIATREALFDTGVNSESGVAGSVVFVAENENDCPNGACLTETTGCHGHPVSVGQKDRESNRLFKTVKTTTVYFKDCRECAAADEKGACSANCDKGTCPGGACPGAAASDTATIPVSATACQAKPACATDACRVSACAESCSKSSCQTAAVQKAACDRSVAFADCCKSCENCDCEACACRRSVSLPPEPAIEIRPLTDEGAPGRVRLTHVLPMANVVNFPNDVQYFPTGRELALPSRQIRLSSFTSPVAAHVRAAAARPPVHDSVEGTWSRTVDGSTIEFTIENGRLHGAFDDARFSGTCSVSEDGQIFGLLDEFEGVGHLVDVIDQPFAVRFRFDGEDLILKDLRCAGLPGTIELPGGASAPLDLVTRIACGRYAVE